MDKKKRAKEKYRRVSKIALNNTKGRSIEERTEEINKREVNGHWEMDCVVSSRGSKGALLVLTERQTRISNIFKMERKTQEEVSKVLNKLEKKHRGKFKENIKV